MTQDLCKPSFCPKMLVMLKQKWTGLWRSKQELVRVLQNAGQVPFGGLSQDVGTCISIAHRS